MPRFKSCARSTSKQPTLACRESDKSWGRRVLAPKRALQVVAVPQREERAEPGCRLVRRVQRGLR